MKRMHLVGSAGWIAGTVACVVALAGCGSGATSAHDSTSSSTATSSTTTTSPADAEVISAWLAAQRAFHHAALTSNPNDPALAATTISPLLDSRRADLTRMRTKGYVAKGPTFYGTPRVVDSGPGKTEIQSCVHDEEIEIVAKTGKPAPGILGNASYELYTSIMQSTATGWKLADQKVESDKCSGS